MGAMTWWSRATVLLIGIVCSQVKGQVIVSTEYGPVEGHLLENVFNGETYADINSFIAVPYGKSTAGALRFAKPEKPDPWTLFVADSLGQSCAQHGGGAFAFTHPGWDNFGEDCLNMNIYAPTTPGPHPVMVWFHGGAYTGGANIQYPGQFLATRDVVVCVVNYRLNDFGFAYTASDAAPGNQGMWDQRQALEFVRDNIANFGGDPNSVTIFGQSAGASSTSLHVVSPQSQGLVHQAIMESGTEANIWSVNLPEQSPETYIWQIADQLNCSQGRNDVEMIDCLRQLPWEAIRDANFRCTPGHFCQGMAPVVDGPGGFLPEKPRDLRASGTFLRGPIMTGIMRDDGSFYTLAFLPESLFGGFNRSEFQQLLQSRLLSIWAPNFDNETQEEIFHGVDYNYAPWPYVEDEYENRNAFNELITDAAFGTPWDRQMLDHSPFAPTYGYLYDYRGRNSSNLFPEWMGVPHMGELPQTWGYPLLRYNDHVRNDSGIMFDIIDWTEEDLRQTVFWQTLYTNFAHTGNPTPQPVIDPLGGMITWTPFSADDKSYLYVYNETVEMQKLWRQQDLAFWDEYMDYLARSYPIPFHIDDAENVGLSGSWYEEIMKNLPDLLTLAVSFE